MVSTDIWLAKRVSNSQGLNYVAEVDYKRADIDFSSQAAKLKETGAEAVILQAVYREPPRLAEQSHAIGYNPVFIGPSPIVVEKTIELGGKHVEGMIGIEVYPLPSDPGALRTPIPGGYAKVFSQSGPGYHQPVWVTRKPLRIAEALQRAGRELTRDSLLQAITTIKDWNSAWGLKYNYAGDDRRVMTRSARRWLRSRGTAGGRR